MQQLQAHLHKLPALTTAGAVALCLHGERPRQLAPVRALAALEDTPHLVCHLPMLRQRLQQMAGSSAPPATSPAAGMPLLETGDAAPRHFDVAELFAFVLPAASAPPLVSSFATHLGLRAADDDPAALQQVAQALLQRLAAGPLAAADQALALARMLERTHWPWAEPVLAALRQRAGTGGGDDGGHRHQHHAASSTRGQDGASSGARADGAAGVQHGLFDGGALAAWERLPEWEENPPMPPAGQQPVQPAEAVRELRRILGTRAEERPAQQRYAAAVAEAFAPRPSRQENTILLAEAGTGLGKTLGYLAPAGLWARRNAGTVWVATYTRNLQRQLLEETRRLWPEEEVHRRRVSVRKGRENYLCLLNAEEVMGQFAARGRQGLLLAALLARWIAATRDGDMIGGDFPAWLPALAGEERLVEATPVTLGLTDRRGECTYAACRHFRKCFIEKARVKAERAEVVIANHAVVLTQAAMNVLLGQTEPHGRLPAPELKRLVLDEGHHLFDAADAAFSGHLTARETAELRRWIRGAEGRRRRGRGLRERLGDLLRGGGLLDLLLRAEEAAQVLPAEGWTARLAGGAPAGEAEAFFALVHEQVLARAASRHVNTHGLHELETDCRPPIEGLAAAAADLHRALALLQHSLRQLAARLQERLEQEAAQLTTTERNRLESLARGLIRRGELTVGGWRWMLGRLLPREATADDDMQGDAPDDGTDPALLSTPARANDNDATAWQRGRAEEGESRTIAPGPEMHAMDSAAAASAHRAADDGRAVAAQRRGRRMVDWFSLARMHENVIDTGMHTHWVDPTVPLAECVLRPADSVVITSATLRESAAVMDGADGWQGAEMRTGVTHLPWVARRAGFASPFDYARQSRILLVQDVDHDDVRQLAAAFQALFMASRGGALGLFTAISRLKAVHQRLLLPLASAGLPLYAQHVDALDAGTLVDIFRARREACLLGTDAMRDGIDVPGDSLRLLVMERVPWARPTILERARQQAFGRQRWSDMQVRLRLRQAFGRLIRRADDRGVFVMLDRRMAGRFLSAFPDGAPVRRCGLAEAVAEVRTFLCASIDTA